MTITATDVAVRDTTYILGGEASGVPGLVITPAISHQGRYTGGWTVTHAASGMHVGIGCTSLTFAREVAILLDVGVGWTRPREEFTGDDVAREAFAAAYNRHLVAGLDGVPLWWGRWSWQQVAPRWLFNDGFDEWSCSWRELLRHTDDDAYVDEWAGEWVDAQFDPRPLWSLRCAAPLCGVSECGVPEAATLPLDGEDELVSLYSHDRGELRETAGERGWRQCGPYWMCRACAREHEPEDWYV